MFLFAGLAGLGGAESSAQVSGSCPPCLLALQNCTKGWDECMAEYYQCVSIACPGQRTMAKTAETLRRQAARQPAVGVAEP